MPDETPPGPPGSAFSSGNGGKAFEAADARQVDAVEHHLQLSSAQLDGVGPCGSVREVIASGFEALTPQAQAVSAPVEHLEPVGRTIAENEEMTAERVGLQAVGYQGEEAVER